MVKKSFTRKSIAAKVAVSEAEPVETGSFTDELPEADSERLQESQPEVVEDTAPEPAPEPAEPPVAKPKAVVGERPGSGGAFVSFGNGRVKRV